MAMHRQVREKARSAPPDRGGFSQRQFTLQRAREGVPERDRASEIVHNVLRSGGQPLDLATRSDMERRLGHDFSSVRVHTDVEAAESAVALDARAYAVGNKLVFGPGQYRPGSVSGRRLLAHELVHVMQSPNPELTSPHMGHSDDEFEHEARRAEAVVLSPEARYAARTMAPATTSPVLRRTPADELARRATYPTAGERGRIQEIVNPQQQEAIEQGQTSPDSFTDPVGFERDMVDVMNHQIDASLVPARARESSGVELASPELTALADVAQPEVTSYYGTYLRAAVHSPAEQASRTAYGLSAHVHEVPTAQTGRTDDTARDWVASRMRLEGAALLRQYHVVTGTHARDQAAFDLVRDHIVSARLADLRTIIRFYPGYEGGFEVYIQRRLVPEYASQPAQETQRRGRWRALGTAIHEMLHAVAHEDFQFAVRGLEESGIATEGFAEYYTQPVYDSLTRRAVTDSTLRTSIEGVQAPYVNPPERSPGGYQRYVDGVEAILNIVGNEENLKVAYFLGRIEYLGLGGWNEAEAARRRYPASAIGVAALLTDSGQGLFRINYGRVVLGRAGAFQIQLGGTINYLTQGERLGLGGTASLQYSWPNVYVRGGLDVAVSSSVTRPSAESVRLDLLPGVEAGVRIGIARVGAGAYLLIPVAGGPVSERTVRVAGGIGASLEF